MEWAEALEILAGFGQRDVMTDDVRDVDPALDLIDDIVGNQPVAHESRNSCILVAHDRTSQ